MADNGGAPITDYELQRWDPTANDNVGDWDDADLLGTGLSTVTLYIDREVAVEGTMMPLAAGSTHHYRLKAKNGTGDDQVNDGWTAALTVKTIAGVPDRPTELTATPLSNSQIQLAWTAPMENNGSPISHYELEVWNTTTKVWDRVGGNQRGPDLRYTHGRRTAETTYVYRVRAVNGAPANSGQGPWSTLASGTTLK